MVAFAAYTGARRSEVLRALVTDIDLDGGVVTLREKKRARGKRSTRTGQRGEGFSRCAGVVVAASRSHYEVCSDGRLGNQLSCGKEQGKE
jgi:integrase